MKEQPTEKELRSEERAEARAAKEEGEISLKSPATEDNPMGISSKYLPSKDNAVYDVSPIELELHELAELMRLHTDPERAQMKQSFIEHGQLVPIVLYRGKVVDGRHRLWTSIDLGLQSIMVMNLEQNLTIEEVEEVVIQLQGGRQLTPSEKAIQAYLYMIRKRVSRNKAATICAAQRTTISQVKYIVDVLGLKKIRDMYDGKTVAVGGKIAKSVNALYKLAIEQEEAERAANSTTKPMPLPEVKRQAQPYLDALDKEHNDVIEFVSKWGWNRTRG